MSPTLIFSVSIAWLTIVSASKVQHIPSRACLREGHNGTIYDYTATDIWGKENITLSQYRGKIVLIVNLATYCTFTKQYLALNELQTKHRDDLVILGFPCNQFLLQEPGENGAELINGLKYVRPGNGYEPNFLLFQKIKVNGDGEHPLYAFLKQHCPTTRDGYANKHYLFYEPFKNWDIRWNFEKFLIDRTGRPLTRYDANTEPAEISNDIEKLIRSA